MSKKPKFYRKYPKNSTKFSAALHSAAGGLLELKNWEYIWAIRLTSGTTGKNLENISQRIKIYTKSLIDKIITFTTITNFVK